MPNVIYLRKNVTFLTVLHLGSSSEQPSTWTNMDKENVAVVTLLQNSQEYQDVLNDFVQSAGQRNIVKVYFTVCSVYNAIV